MSRALDAEIIGGERCPADRVNSPVVASAGRHAAALDEELVVRQCVPDVAVPACRRLVVARRVVGAVPLDVAADVGQREACVGGRQDRSNDERHERVFAATTTHHATTQLGRRTGLHKKR